MLHFNVYNLKMVQNFWEFLPLVAIWTLPLGATWVPEAGLWTRHTFASLYTRLVSVCIFPLVGKT